jgi:hypothetical protein
MLALLVSVHSLDLANSWLTLTTITSGVMFVGVSTGCCGVPIALYDDVEDFVSTGLASTFLSIANSIAAGGVYTESKRSAFLTIRKKPGISLKAVTYLV